jgi:Chloride channel protein EriC
VYRKSLRLLLIVILLGFLVGCLNAIFLLLLSWVTDIRATYPWLLFFLPAAGALIAWSYSRYAQEAAKGINLILSQIHAPEGRGVPFRMVPLVLFSTLLTHLVGGSAGREGTAVQIGGGIAGSMARFFRLDSISTRLLLMAGISAGFSSLFGTPVAGAVFGMEVLALGGIRYAALIPCLLAACVGYWSTMLFPIHHTHYPVIASPELTPLLVGQILLAGGAFAGASVLFLELSHWIEQRSQRLVANPILRTSLGGLLIILVTLALGSQDYNGLSLPLLQAAFTNEGVPAWAFLIKLALTALTLGVGFKGGEVTPLFVIGATLGSALGQLLGLPIELMAALGFVAVFAAAANTPLACLIMGLEIFGSGPIVPLAMAIFVAYTLSGHRGIYSAQRVLTHKSQLMGLAFENKSLHEVRHASKQALSPSTHEK